MTETANSPADRLARTAQRPARLVRMILQLVLGIGLAIGLILKIYMLILTDHVCAVDNVSLGNLIRCTPTLTILGSILALSAGFDLAFRVIEGTLDQAISPVILALGSGFLIIAGSLTAGTATWQTALTLVALTASIGGFFFIKQRLMEREDTS